MRITNCPANRKVLRSHAREAMRDYSPVMTWLVLENGMLTQIVEPQGETAYTGDGEVIATTGDFHKAHGKGAVINQVTGKPYRTQRDYLRDLLGREQYVSLFGSKYDDVCRLFGK